MDAAQGRTGRKSATGPVPVGAGPLLVVGAAASSPRPNGTHAGKPVPSVHAAARILLHLAELGRPVRLTELSRSLSLSSSSCHDILRTLAEFSFVSVDAATKSYSLGAGLARLAHSAEARAMVYAQVEDRMRAFSLRHGVTVTLWEVQDDQHMVLTLQSIGHGIIRLSFRAGQRLPLYIGATGRALAAYSDVPASELSRRFRAFRWQKPLDYKTYAAQIEAARTHGWSRDEGHFAAGVTSLSVPVLRTRGPVNRVLSVTFLSSLEPAGQERLAEELKHFARSTEPLLDPVD